MGSPMIRCKQALVPLIKRLDQLCSDLGEDIVLAAVTELCDRLQAGFTEAPVSRSELVQIEQRLILLERLALQAPRPTATASPVSSRKQRKGTEEKTQPTPSMPLVGAPGVTSEALTTGELAVHLGMTRNTLNSKVSRLRQSGRPIQITDATGSTWMPDGIRGHAITWSVSSG